MSSVANASAAAAADRSPMLANEANVVMARRLHKKGKTPGGKMITTIARVNTLDRLPNQSYVAFTPSTWKFQICHTVSHLHPEVVPFVMGEQTTVNLYKFKIPSATKSNFLQTIEPNLKEKRARKEELASFLKVSTKIPDFVRPWLEKYNEEAEADRKVRLARLKAGVDVAKLKKEYNDLKVDIPKTDGISKETLQADFLALSEQLKPFFELESLTENLSLLEQFLRDPEHSPFPQWAIPCLQKQAKEIDADIALLEWLKFKFTDPNLTFVRLIEDWPIIKNHVRVTDVLQQTLEKVPAVAFTALSPIDESSRNAPFKIFCSTEYDTTVLVLALDDAGTGCGIAQFLQYNNEIPVRAYDGSWRDWKAHPTTEHEAKMNVAQSSKLDNVTNAVSVLVLRFSIAVRTKLPGSSVITAGAVNNTQFKTTALSGAYQLESASFARIHALACRTFPQTDPAFKTDEQILSLADTITDMGTQQLQGWR